MSRISCLTLFALIMMVLAACGGAPAPQSSGATAAPAAISAAPAATVAATAPTAAPAPTAALAATATSAPLADTNPAKPNDATQGRLRVSNCIYHSPNVDVFVNGKVAVSGGWPQTDMGFDTSNYLFLEPGSYSVALVPTGNDIDKALLGPIDVKVDAGHRYTVVAMGQQDEQSHTPLVIDETAAFQEIGAAPTDSVQVTINNLKGVPAFDWFLAGKPVVSNVPYGGFKAAIWPVGYRDDVVKVSGAADKVLHTEGNIQFYGPGRDEIACWGGSYPGSIPANYDSPLSGPTSELNVLDFLQGFTDASAQNGGKTPTFVTLLAAIKKADLTDTLRNDSPYVLFAPTDAAFAALPKDKLDALMADPKGLADLLRNHIVEGYHPRGTLDKRPLMNMLGATFTLHGGEQININGQDVGPGGLAV
jgi:hypothetical protein